MPTAVFHDFDVKSQTILSTVIWGKTCVFNSQGKRIYGLDGRSERGENGGIGFSGSWGRRSAGVVALRGGLVRRHGGWRARDLYEVLAGME